MNALQLFIFSDAHFFHLVRAKYTVYTRENSATMNCAVAAGVAAVGLFQTLSLQHPLSLNTRASTNIIAHFIKLYPRGIYTIVLCAAACLFPSNLQSLLAI